MSTDEGSPMSVPQCDYDGEMTPSLEEAIRTAGVRWWRAEGRKKYEERTLDYVIENLLAEADRDTAPPTLIVGGAVSRSALGFFTSSGLLHQLAEVWDDEYGGPEDYGLEPSVEAERLAALLVDELYRGNPDRYWCNPVLHVRVDVRAWIERHRPAWIKALESAEASREAKRRDAAEQRAGDWERGSDRDE